MDICKIPQEASQLPHTDYQQTVWLFSMLASLVPHIYYSKSGFLINVCCVSSTMLSIQVFIIRHRSTHPFIHVSTHLPIQPFTQLIIYHPLIYSSILPQPSVVHPAIDSSIHPSILSMYIIEHSCVQSLFWVLQAQQGNKKVKILALMV